MMMQKDEEFEKYRMHARISVKATHNASKSPTLAKRTSERSSRSTGGPSSSKQQLTSLEEFQQRPEIAAQIRKVSGRESKRSGGSPQPSSKELVMSMNTAGRGARPSAGKVGGAERSVQFK